jgi:glycosyltransferase involved in cell wall biosynthesis
VLLTKYMAEAIPLYNKPHIVIEGIYTKPDYLIEETKKTEKFTFFYSGSLHKRFGILSLIEAFSLIKNNSIRLWICGSGDAVSFVREACSLDSRITYFGELLHEEVLVMQQQATMLINPRNSDGEYTKYSFPSKTLEYFASGTPAIIHRLPGIPENYFSYCFCPLNNSVSALSDCMLNVINIEKEELQIIGQKAKAFILSEKNNIIQFNKIYDFINNL